jgi:HAD superfamily hydrolase (TIGR01549 family)
MSGLDAFVRGTCPLSSPLLSYATTQPAKSTSKTAFAAILCDLDGTLVDSRRDIAIAFQWALRRVTDEELPSESAIAKHIGKPLQEMAQALGFTFSSRRLAIFLDTYRRYYAIHCARYTQPYPGVTETLTALSGTTFGVVTTKYQGQAEIVLRQLKMSRYFQHVQGWQAGLRLKPAPDTVEATLVALQCHPEQALMVGDTPADMLAGKAASVKICAATYGFGNLEELKACKPDYCIASFHDLVAIVQGERSSP